MIDLLNIADYQAGDEHDEMKLIVSHKSNLTVDDINSITPEGYRTSTQEVLECIEIIEDNIEGRVRFGDLQPIVVWLD